MKAPFRTFNVLKASFMAQLTSANPTLTEPWPHWAASNDDVAMIDALLDAGADIDAPGAVIGDGTPLADATAFAQWRAASRLVERGATATLFDLAALGLLDRVRAAVTSAEPPPADEVDAAFWAACHGGRLSTARFLDDHGANLDWRAPWEPATPLDAAERAGAEDVVRWLRDQGARSTDTATGH